MPAEAQPARRKITIERTFRAGIDDVWELWTTKEGIESWWGPEGFEVTVHRLDLRPGGELSYTMTATAPDQIDFLKKAGMPLAQPARVTFKEVIPRKRLAFRQTVDFVPNVTPYEVSHLIEFEAGGAGVKLSMTLDAMHDEQWTGLMLAGWESELGKLAKLLQGSSRAARD